MDGSLGLSFMRFLNNFSYFFNWMGKTSVFVRFSTPHTGRHPTVFAPHTPRVSTHIFATRKDGP